MKSDLQLFIKEQESKGVKDRLSKYITKWPLFLACLIVCVGAGLVYARYVVPKYIATTKFLIKEDELGGRGSGDLIEAAFGGKREVNLNNEMLRISSTSLMERAVAKHGFNISYYKKGQILTLDVYDGAPFRLVPKRITDSSRTYSFHLMNISDNGGKFYYGPEEHKRLYSFKWNTPFTIDQQIFSLDSNGRFYDGEEYIARWRPIKVASNQLTGSLSVKAYDTKTSVIQLTLVVENLKRGKDVLNALFNEFSLSDIEDRNRLSDRTVSFIDERLVGITEELKGVEGNLENYQNSRQLIDVKSQSDQSLSNSNDVSRTIKGIQIQQGIVRMISEYFLNAANSTKLVPSSMGLNDATLSSLIASYNELKLKKEREAPLLASGSPLMQDLNTQLATLKNSILESLGNISKNLSLQASSFERHNKQYRTFLSSLPHNERILQEIKRKQSITEGLYLYLLQKREEAAISRTEHNVANYKQLDPATGYGPVEPNTKNIVLSTTLLGLFLAFCWIYMKDVTNDRVSSPEDIARRVDAPLLGKIKYIPKRKMQPIAVLNRDIVSEQFRAIRANLNFNLRRASKKVVLVTSSRPGEGKTFVSLNLAVVLSAPGKRVALLEFDIRRPMISNSLQVFGEAGITDFLSGNTDDLISLKIEDPNISNLHIFPAGPTPVNPADLLLSDNLGRLISLLKEEYDYIVMDTPPAGVLKDAFVLAQFSDVVLHVVRQDFTLKKQLDVIQDMCAYNEHCSVGVVFNAERSGRNSEYAGYEPYFEKRSTRKRRKTPVINNS